MAEPDLWDEQALININDGTTDQSIVCLTETIDIDLGDKEGESIPSLCAGRLWKKTPEADTTITFEGYPISVGDYDGASPKGMIQQFMGGTDGTEPLSATSSTTRRKFRVTILWTNDAATGTARGTVTSADYALRYDFQNCYFVSCKPTFTDKVVKATWKFKCPPFNKSGTANITVQSCDATATLDTI